jgi:ribosomal protein S18 acetylase RimI-like enzyme
VYLGGYLALAPEHALVATATDDPAAAPAGYVVGVADTRAFAERCEAAWWPALRQRYPREVPRRPSDRALVELLHAPPAPPDDVVEEFPAHLHLDLLPALQGRGMGRALLGRLLGTLRAAGSTGVHLGVDPGNPRAIGFYRGAGFEVLRADVDVVLMGRALRAQ